MIEPIIKNNKIIFFNNIYIKNYFNKLVNNNY